jgi:hypothetical protein
MTEAQPTSHLGVGDFVRFRDWNGRETRELVVASVYFEIRPDLAKLVDWLRYIWPIQTPSLQIVAQNMYL